MDKYIQGYKKLEKSLTDIVKEEQAKLGYRKERIRLYYPLSSLNHIFMTECDETAMKEILRGYAGRTEYLGNVKVSNSGERFCFNIPEEGVEYVYVHTPENEFVKKLVTLLSRHDTLMEDIFNLFKSVDSDTVITKVQDEFDWLIHFSDKHSDGYYYCFKEEGCHIIYHRFTPEDYEDMF